MNQTHDRHTPFDWRTLPRPFSVLAPMEYVTDSAFRRMLLHCGAPDVMVSEFTHVEKVIAPHNTDMHNRLMYHKEEHPLMAQIWGTCPDQTYRAVKTLIALGFDGIDINMGCPTPRAIERGACSALIKTPALAGELFSAAREAAGRSVPVSIKTRLGFDRLITEPWAEFLLSLKPAALTMHGRIATDMSRGPANWDEIGKVVGLRNAMKSDTLIIGNGDVQSFAEIQEKHQHYKVDGVMLGRAVLKNPLVFRKDGQTMDALSQAQRIQLLWRHATLCRQNLGKSLGFTVIKKYLKIYINDFKGAAQLRDKLAKAGSFQAMRTLLQHSAK
jgi:tRNA-dihydrouridine synthase